MGVTVGSGITAGMVLSSQLIGTTTNDSAAAGILGEFKTTTVAVGSTVALSTATAKDIMTLALTPGDWDVDGALDFILTGTTATLFRIGVSLTADTMPTQAGGSGIGTDPLATIPLLTTALSATFIHRVGTVRVSLAATTTLHLVGEGTFSAGTLSAYGTIRARRVR